MTRAGPAPGPSWVHTWYYLALHLSLVGNSRRLSWVRLQQPQEQRYPFLTVLAVFSCVKTKVWLSVLVIFHVHTDVNAYDCTQGLYVRYKRICSENRLWEKNPLLQWGIEPVSVANRYDTVPPELHPTPLAAYTATVWTRLESELWHHPLQTQHLSAILPDDEPCSGAELSVVYICPKMAKCIDPMLSLSPAQKLLLVWMAPLSCWKSLWILFSFTTTNDWHMITW